MVGDMGSDSYGDMGKGQRAKGRLKVEGQRSALASLARAYLGHVNAGLLEEAESFSDRMGPWEWVLTTDQEGLQGLLDGLLGVEAEIFEDDVRDLAASFGAGEIAAGPTNPLARV